MFFVQLLEWLFGVAGPYGTIIDEPDPVGLWGVA